MADNKKQISLPDLTKPQDPEHRQRRALLAYASRNAKITLRKFTFEEDEHGSNT